MIMLGDFSGRPEFWEALGGDVIALLSCEVP